MPMAVTEHEGSADWMYVEHDEMENVHLEMAMELNHSYQKEHSEIVPWLKVKSKQMLFGNNFNQRVISPMKSLLEPNGQVTRLG